MAFSAVFLVAVLVIAVLILITGTIGGEPVAELIPAEVGDPVPHLPTRSLRVATVNLAHGRGPTVIQRLVEQRAARNNLDRVADLLAPLSPDAVAYQEADATAFWSGRFNHVHYLSERMDMGTFVHGRNVNRYGLSYGTAISSPYALRQARGYTFRGNPPTFPKGWTRAVLPLHPETDKHVEIVSVHLDFARKTQRQKQARDLVRHLADTDHYLCLMGDFNCGMGDDEETIHTLTRELNLKAYRPDADDLHTFPTSGSRLDWILVSHELDFIEYRVLPDRVSDHLVVTAVIGLPDGPRAVVADPVPGFPEAVLRD